MLLVLAARGVTAQPPEALTIDQEPVLCVTAGGPTAFVTSLAFQPGDQTLHAAGYDKVIHGWLLKQGKYVASPNAYRVPIGPGIDGALNSVAISPDGTWIAAAGQGTIQHGGTAGFRQFGIWVPSLRVLSPQMWADRGTIYVFNTRTGAVGALRGHRGMVLSLAFAPAAAGKPPLLGSVAGEFDGKGGYVGIVRLWDVAGAAEVAQLGDLPNPLRADRVLWPRLALWHWGAKPQQVRVALAWEDGRLRLWDVAAGANGVLAQSDGDFNNTVAYLPGSDQLVTTSVVKGKGYVSVWNAAGGQLKVSRYATLPEGQRARALVVLAGAPGQASQAAVLTEKVEAPTDVAYALTVLELASLKAVGSPVPLWRGGRMAPALAASPDGGFLAAAGNQQHEIHVFARADLAKGQDNRQRLRGAGATMMSAAFARKANHRALVLGERARAGRGSAPLPPQEGDLVFDFSQRGLSGDTAGWASDAPDSAGWEARATLQKNEQGPSHWEIAVALKGQAQGTIRLKPGHFLVDYALLPPLPPLDLPLVAAAHVEPGQEMLSLYNARTGELLRQLTGHVNRINSLAFSGDGRFLVTTALDQLICVWTLAKVKEGLGQATLRGLTFARKPPVAGLAIEQIDVSRLTPGNQERLQKANVQEGDVVEGVVSDGKLRPVATVIELLNDVLVPMQPGAQVTLRIKGRGDTTLLLGQVIQEAKPLFSLFVTRGGKADERRWIGWNPVGPYDASDRDAERLLGWHRNTGDPRNPATFALAQEQRAANYKQDILKYLIAQADAATALDAWKKDHPDKPREPKMTLWLNEPGSLPVLATGALLAQKPDIKLFLSIHEFPLGKVQAVRWEVDGKERGQLAPSPDDKQEWVADLSRLTWKRGTHRLRVTLQTAAPEALEYPRELIVDYQPPRPRIDAMAPGPRVVDKAEYRLQVKVTAPEGQDVQVALAHKNLGKELRADKPVVGKGTIVIDKALKLEPGLNQITLVARPAGADDAEAESFQLELLYKTPRPLITLSLVQPVPAGAPWRIAADLPVVVDVPRVRIVGEVEALDNLAQLSWAAESGGKLGPRTPLAVDKKTRLTVQQEIATSAAGLPLKLHFYAKSATSDEGERVVTVLYQPRLPEVRLTSPVDGQPFVVGRDPLPARVEARLGWPEDRHGGTAQLVVNGRAQGQPITLDTKAATFVSPVALEPGENAVQLQLKNAWRESITPKVLVSYRRPPRVLALKGPAQATRPFADLVALVESPAGLPLTQLRLQDREVPIAAAKPTVVEKKGAITVFELALRELPLQKGKNHLELLAGNADGWALVPATIEIEVLEVMEPRALVTILSPRQDLVVQSASVTVEFGVRSASPLQGVRLERNGDTVFQKGDFAGMPKNAAGLYEVRLTQAVPLVPGPNSLKVLVHNAGGVQLAPPVLVTYQPAPVRVAIDYLLVDDVPMSPGGVLGDNTLYFSVASERVKVRGHVEWDAHNDPALARVNQVRVSVNGFQQGAAVLEPAAGKQRLRPFVTEVRLTRPAGNRIAVQLPELSRDQNSRQQCLVDTSSASALSELRRQAHLLIVDTDRNLDEASTVQRVYGALEARASGENRFSKPGFADGGRLYGPLVGADVTPEKVYMQLLIIKRSLRRRAEAGAVHDVVFLYFRGGETIDGQGHFFRTGDSERDPELRWSGIPCDYLTRFFAENLGAQIVLLDVTRESRATPAASGSGTDRVALWPEDPSVVVVRYAWLGSAQTQTEDARLLADWSEASRQESKLKDIARVVSEKFIPSARGRWESKKFADRLTFFQQLPPSLEDVPLGQK